MRILMLNWRCPSNPQSGGAEYVTRKHLEAWTIAGHEVHWLAGGYGGAKQYEQLPVSEITKQQCVDSVHTSPLVSDDLHIHLHRHGSPLTIYLLAPLLYWLRWRGKFDVVIDQIHGIPFLTPLWAWKSRKIAFIHEVAQEIWDEMLPFPINIFGKLYEKMYFWFYRKIPFWTDSNSTKNDLIVYGIPERNVHVIPCAIDLDPVSQIPEKEERLTLLFVGRLVKMKGVEDAIRIFSEVRKSASDAQLWIVGSGDKKYVDILKRLVSQLKLSDAVVFLGYVSEQDKIQAYRRAHFLLHTSVREGFGLTILEANSQGTPVVAYRMPGIRELISEGRNGFFLESDVGYLSQYLGVSDYKTDRYQTLVMSSLDNNINFSWKQIFPRSIGLVLASTQYA